MVERTDAPAAIEALRAHCRAKAGSYEGLNSGKHYPHYFVLGGSMSYFAMFRLEETPALLLVRCANDALGALEAQTGGRVKRSTHLDWRKPGWTWVEAPLDGSVPGEMLLPLIDTSYAMTYEELSDHAKQFVALYDSRPKMEEAFERLIDLYRLRHRRDDILKLMQPAIRLVTTPCDEKTMGPLRSRIGGVPHLPASWTWPSFEGKPMAFLAQLNLTEVPAEARLAPLPSQGILYFFSMLGRLTADGDHDPDCCEGSEDPGITQVLYYEGDSTGLTRRAGPRGIRTFDATTVSYHAMRSIPSTSDYTRDPATLWLQWTMEELESLFDLDGDLDTIYKRQIGATTHHQLLGYAGSIQETVVRVGERLLFQLYSDANPRMMWGDAGTLFFLITDPDLRARRFSAVRAETQCG